MAQKILLKRSSVALKVPASSSLDLGELGANTNDAKLFIKEGNHLVREIATTSPAGVSQSLFLSTASAAVVGVGTTTVTATNNLVVAGDAFFSASTLQPGAGNITASGNISSSGEFIGLSANITALTASNGFQASADSYIQHADTPKLVVKDTTNNYGLEIEQGNLTSTIRFDDNAAQDLYFDSNKYAQHLVLDGGTGGSTFAGDITASANISASGNIIGNNLEVNGNITASGIIDGNTNSLILGDKDGNIGGARVDINQSTGKTRFRTTNVEIGESDGALQRLTVYGHTTASGNISSSGTIYMTTASIGGGSFNSASLAAAVAGGGGGGTTTNALTVDNATLQLDSGTTFNGSAARTIAIKDGGVDSDALAADISVTSLTSSMVSASHNIYSHGNLFVKSHITASGNISASGDIFANSIKLAEGSGITYADELEGPSIQIDSVGQIMIDSAANVIDIMRSGTVHTRFNPGTKSTDFVGNVTASGTVSASGYLEGDIKYKISTTAAGNTGGADVVYFGAAESLTAGAIYYFNSSGEWAQADASAAATATGMLAVAKGTALTDGLVLRGMVTLVADPGTIGDVIYLSTAATRAQASAPTATGEIARIIGYCVDSSTNQVYFNPDNTWIELT